MEDLRIRLLIYVSPCELLRLLPYKLREIET